LKTFNWARLNFELQSILSQPGLAITFEIENKLYEVGYTDGIMNCLSPKEIEGLFKEEAFFSCIKTGNRIVAFVLKANGLKKETFKDIEESITNAYWEIKKLNGTDKLVERSYTYTLEALSVFRP
jgi:hypothetical protein